MADDPLGSARKLQKAVESKAKELGLDVKILALKPGKTSKDDLLYVALTVKPEAIETAEEKEQSMFDEAFEDIAKGFSTDEEEGEELEPPDNPLDQVNKFMDWFDND